MSTTRYIQLDNWKQVIEISATCLYLLLYASYCIMSSVVSVINRLLFMFPTELLVYNQWKTQLLSIHECIDKEDDKENVVSDNYSIKLKDGDMQFIIYMLNMFQQLIRHVEIILKKNEYK